MSATLLDEMKKYQNEISVILAGLHSSDDSESWRLKCVYKIDELVNTEKDAREKLNLLEHSFIFAGKLLSFSGSVLQEISERKDQLRIIKMKDLNEDFWGPQMPLLQIITFLRPVMESVSFMNVAKAYLEETGASKWDTSHTDLLPLFRVLATEGIHRFKDEWWSILLNPDSLKIGGMKAMLGGLKSESLAHELSILEGYLEISLPPKVKLYMKDCINYSRVFAQVKHLINLLEAFEILDPARSDLVVALTEFLEKFGTENEIVLKDLHDPITKVDEIISKYDLDKTEEMIKLLGQSHELVDFLKEIVDEDMRILIDAVEEHSDQFVSVSLVSDLIQIHGFLAPVIKQLNHGFSPDLVLMTLINECKKQEMLLPISHCGVNVHSLRELYQNVANRDEMTREIIENCLNIGTFDISLQANGSCQITMSYTKDEINLTKKSMADLQDLRSRAHLIIRSNKRSPHMILDNSDETDEEINFQDFIEQINLLSEIEEAIINLRSSGYIKYQRDHEWLEIEETEGLQELNNSLRKELDAWQDSLDFARQQYYFLNYYWSDQLCVLYNFLTNPDQTQINFEDVVTLINFVDPTIDRQRLREYRAQHLLDHYPRSSDTPREIVSTIGNALEDLFSSSRPLLRNIFNDTTSSLQPVECNARVRKGEIYVAVLEEDSPLTVNVMLALYESTTEGYPESHQVIFCSPYTTWEQIKIFLQRCFNPMTYGQNMDNILFCLANVELLTNEIQFELVDFIKRKESQDGNLDHQLAIICRGGDHHHIVEEFSKFRHSISGMTYSEISLRFRSEWPNVKFVTSTLPGLGKTELIHQEAMEKRKNVVSFPISGQFDPSNIIKRLKQLDLKSFQSLHFDIGEVDDPVLLDTFLFQLIVTGIVSCGTQLYRLEVSNTFVYFEVANSLNDRLRESLGIAQCFTSVELQWENYSNLKVSSKITSDIQVVCQYLDVLEKNRLESMDIHFSGQQKVKPLSPNRCRELLRNYYSTNADVTFTALNTFLGLLAGQLRKFSRSAFFETENLKLMLESKAVGVRNNLLKALLDVSKDFAARSLKSCSSSQAGQALSRTSAQKMIDRVEGMIQWEESNHLLIVFHGVNSQTIAAFYREKDHVPRNVSDLLKSQIVKGRSKELDDFKKMSHEELQKTLERIVRPQHGQQQAEENVQNGISGYALTPDNMLKMILIILRVRANVPIIVMGETGCGKTSLVEYLARTCQIPFLTFNFHAGRKEAEIEKFIERENIEARKGKGQRWLFLDEINTCHHLGLLNEIMCHHTMYGRPLSKKLVLLAACNPYKLRPKESATTAGLEGKTKYDEYSDLVYRVHPLPETMADFVWDYGSLTPQDEKAYIRRMVQKLPREYQHVLDNLVELLTGSQEFIRKSENNPFCVSLRDVRRCIVLIEWFFNMIKERADVVKKKGKPRVDTPVHVKKFQDLSCRYDNAPAVKSVVLALAHCYLSRLQTENLREEYMQSMAQLFSPVSNEDDFEAIIRTEQEDYLDRMDLPEGTARNAALRENVFVMLVSILNRIPVFVVGKPGCSKSLAIQLIRSNLRGKDSKDHFFKTQPHLYVVSYQGSESSTSEGIEEIFKKASDYKLHNTNANVLPVVLLDEVGLAEESPNNPLKVLHSLLEPGKGKLPDVAVVGISNWALDPAKMNRAIHLSRPEPTVMDLEETAISLYQAENTLLEDDLHTSNVLRSLAKAYHEYQENQGYANFHGLRDYYSLVKSLSADSSKDMYDQISLALQRNFGGIAIESSKVQNIFIDVLKSHVPLTGEINIPVTTLIEKNLKDLKARHLMLITNGDSAIGILQQILSQADKETITIFGSRFEEDRSDDYNYRMLSRIILCMERSCVLILRDLECIYGSLYDMLNQNYAVVGKRKNCRVALGANSNPMCYVNDGFRCIVLVDHDEIDYSDHPFYNRFEKQLLRFSDVLNERQEEIIEELQVWVHQMSSVEDLEDQFVESDMFMGFHEDTLPSLVLLHSSDTDESNEEIVKKCKKDLMWIATPDGVLRTQKSERFKEDPQEINTLSDEYFDKPVHNGLASFLNYALQDQEYNRSSEGDVSSKIIVMTYATVHTDINKCFDDTTRTYQLERLGSYKSEKQLEDRINNFFFSDKELLVLQCKPELDSEHMLLARSIIEDKRNAYAESNLPKQMKHVCILVHIRRVAQENTVRWQFNFLSGWRQVFLDALDVPPIVLNEMRDETIENLLSESVWSFRGFAVKCIVWCFNCIKYIQDPRPEKSTFEIANKIFTSEKVYVALQKLVLQHVEPITDDESDEMNMSWQVKVACELQLLINSSSFSSAMEEYLFRLIRYPLAKIVYFLERENAWPPHLFSEEDDMIGCEDIWCKLFQNHSIFDISKIPECLGNEAYPVGGVRLNLRVPFSQVIFDSVNAAKNLVMKEYEKAMEDELSCKDIGELTTSAQLEQLQRYSKILGNCVPCLRHLPPSCLSSYMADVLEIISADFDFSEINRQQCISFTMCAFLSFAKRWVRIENPLELYSLFHLFVWTSKDKVNCLLELINCCHGFEYEKRLDKETRKFFQANKDVLPLRENGPIDERLYISRRNRKSSESSSGDSDGETSDSDTSSSGESDSESSGSDASSSEDETNESTERGVETDEECFEDILVTVICEKMFPSEMTISMNFGVEPWIRNISKLLSLALKMNNQTPAFHFLRLCEDYSKMVGEGTGIPDRYLYILDEIGTKLKPDYLDAGSSLQIITESLIGPIEDQLRGEEENHALLQEFLAQFYSRCIETNIETESARPIIEHVLSLHGKEVLIMTPVIYRLLFAENAKCPGIFFDIIINQGVHENHSFLYHMDEVFKNHFSNGSINHDSYLAVVICDLIYFIQNFDQHFSIEHLTHSDSKLLKCFRSATNVLTGGENYTGLVLLSSVAFLRAFCTMLSKNPRLLTNETPYSHAISEINSLLASGGSRRLSLQMFFLKQLYGDGLTMFDLRKVCCDSVYLPIIKSLLEQTKIVNKVELVSAYRLPEYEEVKAAYFNLSQSNEADMLMVLKDCHKSTNHRLALLGILVNTFYIKKAVGNLTDKEERLADWFRDKSKNFPSPFKELLLRIVGRGNFNHHGLNISLESSTNEIETALLILHVSCVVASCVKDGISPLFNYFANPKKCHGTWIPGQGKQRKRRVFDKLESCNAAPPASCPCGLRIKCIDQKKTVCPSCGAETVNEDSEEASSKVKIYYLKTKSKEGEECTENMDSSVFRALDLIVHACLYAGVAAGISPNDAVSDLLSQDTKGATSTITCKDPAVSCFSRVKTNLQLLTSILSCNSRTAVNFMHHVIEECTELIQGTIPGKEIFSTPEECKGWENQFANIAESFLNTESFESAKSLKEQRMELQDKNEKRSFIEWQIEELDEYSFDPEKQDEELKRLFRITKQPSFKQLRSIFHNSYHQSEHSVLAVFLSKFDELPLVSCLFPLLRLNRYVSSKLTHRISRKEAGSLFINDLINGKISGCQRNESEVEEVRHNVKEFIHAWNRMRDFVNQELLPEGTDDMPFLMEHTCKLGYCLTEGDLGIFLRTAIKILQSVQNNILDELIVTFVRTKNPALNFLEKNKSCCAVASVSLQNVKKKDIIAFEWSDKFLKYAQNPEYGEGEEIYYDFRRMEMELAREIALGKCHLTESISTFVFSKELFHASARILTKIREICPQSESLPEQIRHGLRDLKEQRIQDAQNLIQHIEVVIFLLNMKSISADEADGMTLEEFAEICKPMLPNPFAVDLLPEPKASIKISHIAALYEALEDLLADGSIGGLPRQFREELTDEYKTVLNDLVDSRNGSLKLKQFLTALRRFVFRYLSTEKFLPEPHTTLRSCLSEPSLWSPDHDNAPKADVIPEEMTLANIHAIIRHLEQVTIFMIVSVFVQKNMSLNACVYLCRT